MFRLLRPLPGACDRERRTSGPRWPGGNTLRKQMPFIALLLNEEAHELRTSGCVTRYQVLDQRPLKGARRMAQTINLNQRQMQCCHVQSLKAVSQLASLLQDGGLWAPPPTRPPVPAFSATPAASAAGDSGIGNANGDSNVSSGSAGGTPASSSARAGADAAAGHSAAASPAGRSLGATAVPVKLVGFSKGGTVLNQVWTAVVQPV
jgi:hypothetical protein